jgi:uncharacterized protein YbcI
MPHEPVARVEHGDLLGRISREMVQAQKQLYGKGPKAKSYLLDNFLLVVMSGGVLKAERTMLDQGREELVRGFRQQFENEMSQRLVGLIEEITGRTVINYQSQIVFDPDMVFEIFVFEDTVDDAVQVAGEPGS